ncbi:hypothetical protein CITRIK5_70888 [Citricoccus sp. K5]|uniref:Transposase DDE domain-containing protein n=1 Tax=Citricoccus parietis TaxID=592307 RepID=A0ABV5G9M4_9MICC|nr:hypothetical protein CITRIK5_70888 [Citricoccus sp. K5]
MGTAAPQGRPGGHPAEGRPLPNRPRRVARGDRPVCVDTEAYRRRNVVEGSFNVFKQWRGLATRYDKLTLTCRGGVMLPAITIRIKALVDIPRWESGLPHSPRLGRRKLQGIRDVDPPHHIKHTPGQQTPHRSGRTRRC